TPPGPGTKEQRKAEFIDLMLKKLIPMVSEKKLAKFCDVFLEDGYYNSEETKTLLLAAKKHGLIPKIHADEFTNQEGALLAVELDAASADHLLHISNKGIEALAGSNTVGTVLPGTSFNLRLPYAPAKKMIDAGVCLAIASDFNPGSNASLNMQLMLAIAVNQTKISVAQAIAAGCYGGARALRIDKDFGHLGIGAIATFQVYDANNYNDLFYNYGENFLREIIFAQNSAKS
ncbi:MAG: amidohydrolase family protein, partial [bacterium]